MFGGLHELSVKSTEPEEIILNPEEVPNWLTGEEGASIGEIRNGNFITKSMDESLGLLQELLAYTSEFYQHVYLYLYHKTHY